MGRVASGVRGIRLREGDIAVGMDTVSEGDEILVVTEKGFGKRTPEHEYRIQIPWRIWVEDIECH